MENSQAGHLQASLKKIIGERIAKQRVTMDYSQKDVVEELRRYGLARTQGSLSQIENGKRLPSVEMLYILTRYLETSADYLLGFTENELAVTDIEQEESEGKNKIDLLMRHLTKEQRRQVIAFAEYLLSQAGRSEALAHSNEEALAAALNVYQRKHGQLATDDMIDLVADNFPSLADVVGMVAPAEHRRINKG